MSFAEMVIVMGLLTLMAFFLIVAIRNVVPNSQATIAEENLNKLNAAILGFNQANWELVLEPQSGTGDELAIFRSLQYRHPTAPAPGSPFIPPELAFVSSTDETTYRARWNGRQFELLLPETAGAGLDLSQMVENSGSPAVFAPNYAPVGAH